MSRVTFLEEQLGIWCLVEFASGLFLPGFKYFLMFFLSGTSVTVFKYIRFLRGVVSRIGKFYVSHHK